MIIQQHKAILISLSLLQPELFIITASPQITNTARNIGSVTTFKLQHVETISRTHFMMQISVQICFYSTLQSLSHLISAITGNKAT